MILTDVNVLLYANNAAAREFARTKAWLEETLAGNKMFGLSWHSIMGFLRISTSARIFPNPYSADEALTIIGNLIYHPNSTILDPGIYHFQIFRRVVKESRISGPKLMLYKI